MNEHESRLDALFCEAFDTNHPAMLDWVAIKFELKGLRAKVRDNTVLKRDEPPPCGCLIYAVRNNCHCYERGKCLRLTP
jgi:hypothetical protein